MDCRGDFDNSVRLSVPFAASDVLGLHELVEFASTPPLPVTRELPARPLDRKRVARGEQLRQPSGMFLCGLGGGAPLVGVQTPVGQAKQPQLRKTAMRPRAFLDGVVFE